MFIEVKTNAWHACKTGKKQKTDRARVRTGVNRRRFTLNSTTALLKIWRLNHWTTQSMNFLVFCQNFTIYTDSFSWSMVFLLGTQLSRSHACPTT